MASRPMKREYVIRRLERFIHKWRGCKFDYKLCSEALRIVESCEPTLYNSWDWSRKEKKGDK